MKRQWIFAVFLFVCSVLLPTKCVSAQGTARAVVISRGDYEGTQNDLYPGPENDSENFRRILRQAYGEDMQITSLSKEAEKSTAVIEAVKSTFAAADTNDINYFYYSGHGNEEGMMLENGELLSAKALAQAFSHMKGTNFLVIDCCYSGNLISSDDVKDHFSEKFVREFQEEIARIKKRSALTNNSFHVLAATVEDQLSLQAELGEKKEPLGFFTSAVSAGCGINFKKISFPSGYECTAMADGNRDGNITMAELYDYVHTMLRASEATVWPENDDTVFLPVAAEQIPTTAVTDVQLTLDEAGTPVLDVSYHSGDDGIFQAALYKYTYSIFGSYGSNDLEDAVVMAVESDVTAFNSKGALYASSWEFKADAQTSVVSLPLGIEGMEAGNYFLLLNQQGGNTGCYLFSIQLKQRINSNVGDSLEIQAANKFSIEEEGTLPIRVDFGNSIYPNRYVCPVTCVITSGYQQVYTQTVQEIETEWTGEVYQRYCSFIWDGKDNRGKQVAAGTYNIVITVGSGSNTWKKQKQITVESQAEENGQPSEGKIPDISWRDVELSKGQFVYDGKKKCPKVFLVGLQEGVDYAVAYEGNMVDAGTVTVRVTGIGKYTGTMTATYKILPAPLSKASISVDKSFIYNGKAQKAGVAVRYGVETLKNGRDYYLTYSNYKNPGYANVVIEGKGNYSGKVTKTYKILPTAPKSLKAVRKKQSRTVTVSWRKVEAVSGYQIQYSESANFKNNVKTKKISGKSNVQMVVKVKQAKKKYYFRVRSFKISNGKTLYSTWKSLKTAK